MTNTPEPPIYSSEGWTLLSIEGMDAAQVAYQQYIGPDAQVDLALMATIIKTYARVVQNFRVHTTPDSEAVENAFRIFMREMTGYNDRWEDHLTVQIYDTLSVYRKAFKKAIIAMGDASTRKDEDIRNANVVGNPAPSPTNPILAQSYSDLANGVRPSEISDTAKLEKEIQAIISPLFIGHDFNTAMSLMNRISKAISRYLRTAEPQCILGVGDGSGKLFVHGDYDSIKACQALILREHKPVSVSLEKCANAATNELKRQMGGHPIPGVPEEVGSWTAIGDVQCSDFNLIAKAVLDAAGAKYVD